MNQNTRKIRTDFMNSVGNSAGSYYRYTLDSTISETACNHEQSGQPGPRVCPPARLRKRRGGECA